MVVLPIRLGVEPRGEAGASSKSLAEGPPDLRGELWASVQHNVHQDTMQMKNMGNHKSCCLSPRG